MKKMIIILLALCFIAPVGAFALDLTPDGDAFTSIKLSNQVSGTYFALPATAAATPLAYQLSTGHKQGDKVYATGSANTRLYVKDSSDPDTDLLGAYVADALSSSDDWDDL
jgi:hypothetical protein